MTEKHASNQTRSDEPARNHTPYTADQIFNQVFGVIGLADEDLCGHFVERFGPWSTVSTGTDTPPGGISRLIEDIEDEKIDPRLR